jgi:AAA15 family ATPase/GTPase
MVASSDDALPKNVIKSAQGTGIDLLKSVAVYGANASGKSNLMNAMILFISLIKFSKQIASREIMPFIFDKTSSSNPSTFEAKYISDGVIYNYGFSLDSQRVHKEWLHSYPKKQKRKLFERSLIKRSDKYKYQYGPHWKGEKKRLEKLTSHELLFLHVCNKFNHKVGKEAIKWFNNIFMTYGDIGIMQNILEKLVSSMIQDGTFPRKDVIDFLKKADLGIDDIIVESKQSKGKTLPFAEVPESVKNMLEKDYDLNTIHRMINKKGNEKDVIMPFSNESDGTKKYYSLSVPFLVAIRRGMIFTADELDRHLHPLLLQNLIQMIHDKTFNKNDAQMIFTAHDTSILDSRLFRRDQIWFTEKNKSGATQLFSLWDIKGVKKNENLVRNYLAGHYGAIPILSGRIK